MKNYVFIASLSHSGSTLVDLLVGAHSSAVSLGEIHSTIRKLSEPQKDCTCGKAAEECDIWGELLNEYRSDNSMPYSKAYQILSNAVTDQYGTQVTIVDSSKKIVALKEAMALFRENLKILHLIRDVRGFVHSQISKSRSTEIRDGRRSHLGTGHYANLWFLKNSKLMSFLEKSQLRCFKFGYEELCFFSKPILKKICDFVGIDYEANMLELENTNRHILRGNRMRFESNKITGIYYDNRWTMHKRSIWENWMLSKHLKWNQRHIYSNLDVNPFLSDA